MAKRVRDLFDITQKREKTRATLCQAINARRVIEFYYHGGYRTVEPFALGITMHGEADNESLICYQTGGYSDSNKAEGWKLYRASEMEDITVTKEPFTGLRPGYDPENIDMMEVVCCVRPGKAAPDGVREAPWPVSAAHTPVVMPLSHNEMMRRFRITHPLPIPEPNTRN
jgi:hypothetical protein